MGFLEDFFGITDVCADIEEARFDTGFGVTRYRLHAENTKIDTFYNWRIARSKMFNKALYFIMKNGFSHLYFRRAILDDLTLTFFKNLKKLGVTIIYEVPTYPYDLELEHVKPLIKKMELKYRHELKQYVDVIVTPSPLKINEKIFGIDVMYIQNGIIVDNIKETVAGMQENNTISTIGVAGLASWHAYERFIEGLNEYYLRGGERNIVFHIVGGNEYNECYRLYQKLVDEYSLQEHVILHGTKHGEDLDRIFDTCNIGVEALGNSRKGIHVSSSLKTREYTARGLPVIASGKVDIYDQNYKYVMYVPEDESPVDINAFVDFYDTVYPNSNSYKQVHDEIRYFSINTCDMRQLMKPIVEYINSTKQVRKR